MVSSLKHSKTCDGGHCKELGDQESISRSKHHRHLLCLSSAKTPERSSQVEWHVVGGGRHTFLLPKCPAHCLGLIRDPVADVPWSFRPIAPCLNGCSLPFAHGFHSLALMCVFCNVIFLPFILKSPPCSPKAGRTEVHFTKLALAEEETAPPLKLLQLKSSASNANSSYLPKNKESGPKIKYSLSCHWNFSCKRTTQELFNSSRDFSCRTKSETSTCLSSTAAVSSPNNVHSFLVLVEGHPCFYKRKCCIGKMRCLLFKCVLNPCNPLFCTCFPFLLYILFL